MARESTDARSNLRDDVTRIVCVVLGALTILAYRDIGENYYRGFWMPHGFPVVGLSPEELAHFVLFVLFGTVAIGFYYRALDGTALVDRAVDLFRQLRARPRWVAIGSGLFMLLLGAGVSRFVLGGAAICDDEHTYRFIAQTLRTGSVVAPSPGSDLGFFREQFVVLTEHARYGKYPIGYPVLLAVGQALGAETLVVPLLAALLVVPLLVLGRLCYGETTAVLGVLLYVSSPQMVLTSGTALSQPASALCACCAAACLLAAEEKGGRPNALLALAGASLGYGVLVRPFPGLLFALVAIAYLWFRSPLLRGRRLSFGRWLALLAPLAFAAAAYMAVNHAQTGAALTSGYQSFHRVGTAESLAHAFELKAVAMSLSGALVRLDVWFLGSPIALLFCLLARRNPRAALLWGFVAAGWVYRVLSPKTAVGGVGPVYLHEIVPFLCVLCADGMICLARAGFTFRGRRISVNGVATMGLAGFLVSLTMFFPVKLADLERMGEAQRVLPELVQKAQVHNALVFLQSAVPPTSGKSWAYFPRCNSPGLDDDVLYVRFDPLDPPSSVAFWKRRFPGRKALYFDSAREWPTLVGLGEHVFAQQEPGQTR